MFSKLSACYRTADIAGDSDTCGIRHIINRSNQEKYYVQEKEKINRR